MSRGTALSMFMVAGSLVWTGTARAQRGDWTTAGSDAQRTSWVQSDAKISPDSMTKPGFEFLWKVKLDNEARGSNALTPPALVERYIGYRGFRAFGFFGGSGDRVYALDTDLARMEWERKLTGATPARSTPECPGGMTANVANTTNIQPMAAFGRGFGRGSAAKSGVGKPGEGAVTLAEMEERRRQAPPRPVRLTATRPGGALPSFFDFGGRARLTYALASDGSLYIMYVSNGTDAQPPMKFLPPNANAHGLMIAENVAYVATKGGCGGVPDGVWALDLPSKKVTSWKSNGGVAGTQGFAVSTDATIYAATTKGDLVALEAKTLQVKGSYSAGAGFTSTPVVIVQDDKSYVAAATGDGRIHLLDAASLNSPLAVATYSKAAGFAPSALTTWEDSNKTRWILAAAADAVVAWKLVSRSGKPALEQGWVSRAMTKPLTPMVINGVVFAVSGGDSPAILYALDGETGKELWSSGKTITSPARGGGISGGSSQIYVTTQDSTLWAFGYPIEH